LGRSRLLIRGRRAVRGQREPLALRAARAPGCPAAGATKGDDRARNGHEQHQRGGAKDEQRGRARACFVGATLLRRRADHPHALDELCSCSKGWLCKPQLMPGQVQGHPVALQEGLAQVPGATGVSSHRPQPGRADVVEDEEVLGGEGTTPAGDLYHEASGPPGSGAIALDRQTRRRW